MSFHFCCKWNHTPPIVLNASCPYSPFVSVWRRPDGSTPQKRRRPDREVNMTHCNSQKLQSCYDIHRKKHFFPPRKLQQTLMYLAYSCWNDVEQKGKELFPNQNFFQYNVKSPFDNLSMDAKYWVNDSVNTHLNWVLTHLFKASQDVKGMARLIRLLCEFLT